MGATSRLQNNTTARLGYVVRGDRKGLNKCNVFNSIFQEMWISCLRASYIYILAVNMRARRKILNPASPKMTLNVSKGQ